MQATIQVENSEVYKVLKPEETKSERFETKVELKDKKTVVTVKAKDATALKALTSSVLNAIEVNEKIKNGRR